MSESNREIPLSRAAPDTAGLLRDARPSARFEREYFETNYRDYDAQNPSYKLEHYRSAVERHLPPGIPRRLHDVGCAFGRFAGALGPDWQAHGSDVSRYAIEQARVRFPHVRFCVADGARELPFDGTFGVVTSFDTLEHVPDCDGVVDRVRAQLMPGGLFVFVVPAYDGATAPLHRALDRDPTHVHKWPRRAWLDWAARRFRVLEWHGIARYLLPGGFYFHWTTRRLRDETPAILVVCRHEARVQ
ncbi:MAG: class I SAM-dependent methyltransferase [Polyangiales bacterium]